MNKVHVRYYGTSPCTAPSKRHPRTQPTNPPTVNVSRPTRHPYGSDVEDECDGWLSYDRVEKFDANQTKWVVAAQQRIQAAARQYGPIGAPI